MFKSETDRAKNQELFSSPGAGKYNPKKDFILRNNFKYGTMTTEKKNTSGSMIKISPCVGELTTAHLKK